MSPRHACLGLVVLSLAAGCQRTEWMGSLGRGGSPADDAPNVLVISLDTLRADHLAEYGHDRATAPTLSALAAQGARFEHAWSQAPATDGTHASLFTGRHISSHGKFSHTQRLGEDQWTLAEHFRDHGYRTFAVATSFKFLRESGFDQGFESWDLHAEGPKNTRGTDALEAALDQVDDGDGPFLGFVHFFDVHAPYTAPPPHRTAFQRAPYTLKPGKTVFYIRKHRTDRAIPLRKLHTLQDLYDGGIQYVDTRVARVWAAAQATRRPTIVVIFSDHGEAFSEHAYLGHDNVMWDEVTRVPWLVWAPDRVAPGLTIPTPAQTADIYPTVAELAGLPVPEGLDGASFAPALRGEAGTVRSDRIIPIQDSRMWALVTETEEGLFKLQVDLKPRTLALYDLSRDPAESLDVQAEHPALMERLVAELERLDIRHPERNSIERTDITPEEEEALRAIGYVE